MTQKGSPGMHTGRVLRHRQNAADGGKALQQVEPALSAYRIYLMSTAYMLSRNPR